MVKAKRYRIVYEDDQLIVIDKPSGLLVIPAPGKSSDTLTDLINKDLDGRGIEINAYPCHRLDRETSGLILYAKGKAIQRAMMDEFQKREVKKVYIAFVSGIVRSKSGTITNPIHNRNKDRQDSAITRYKVLERRGQFSVVEVEPVTGRTNQIRIHMKSIGHPLVGETVYAFRRDSAVRFKRAALHAERIEFIHPSSGKKMSFTCALPDDMARLIGK